MVAAAGERPGWRLPEGFERFRVGRAVVVARPAARSEVERALAEAGSLYAWAAAHPAAAGLEGRGPAWVVPAGGGRWVVRHYRRGGAAARWLGDRYARVGVPRPLRELAASEAVRARGVPTPAVAALVVYPSAAVYRADLATEYVPGSVDLARALFGPDSFEGEDRLRACAEAGALVRRLHEAGVVHADLNLKNVLVVRVGGGVEAHLLDLDRCRVGPPVPAAGRRGMLRRLERSLAKWEARAGRRLEGGEREAFEAGYRGGAGAGEGGG